MKLKSDKKDIYFTAKYLLKVEERHMKFRIFIQSKI